MSWDDRLDHMTASVKTRDLVSSLSNGIFKSLYGAQDVFHCFGRRPREEWLYGIICQAILGLQNSSESLGNETDFIFTELPIERTRVTAVNLCKGKIDFAFSYRNILFLMEIKATLCAEKPGDSLPSSIARRWEDLQSREKDPEGVVDQLRTVSLRKNNNGDILKIMEARGLNAVVPLPMLLVTYQRQSKDSSKLTADVEDWHNSIWDSKEFRNTCEMQALHVIETPSHHKSKSRRGPDVLRSTLGYGIFAGDKRLPIWKF